MGRNFGFFPFLIEMNWIYILGVLGWIGCLCLVPALLKKRKYDHAYLEELKCQEQERLTHLQHITEETVEYEKLRINLESCRDNLSKEIDEKHSQVIKLRGEEKVLQANIANLAVTEEQIRTNMETAIEQRSEALSKEYREAELAHAKEYEIIMIDAVEDFNKEWNKKVDELLEIKRQIADKHKIYEAIVEDQRRKARQKADENFCRLTISEEDLKEIEKIREITPYLKNPEVLNKVLWTSYYQKPYQDLIARLFNVTKPSGIYKITCLPDSKIYIGQSVNVPNRFSEHIKRGLGAEPATKNRLYSAMKKWGVENFTFELMEEVPKDKLNERERYWIDYFQSAEFDIGLNGNKGVKE